MRMDEWVLGRPWQPDLGVSHARDVYNGYDSLGFCPGACRFQSGSSTRDCGTFARSSVRNYARYGYLATDARSKLLIHLIGKLGRPLSWCRGRGFESISFHQSHEILEKQLLREHVPYRVVQVYGTDGRCKSEGSGRARSR